MSSGEARTGMAELGEAGQARFVGSGKASPGKARPVRKEKRMIYEWKTINYKTSAEVAGKVCSHLENTVGLTAKNLVEASRPEDAPLHNEFEWRDDIAAEKYREQQARVLICNLVVKNEGCEPVRAYVSLTRSQETYESINVVLRDADKTEMLFNVAMRELASFKKKYADIKKFAKLFKEISRLEEEK